ncbi:MAG TPA: cytochrome c oxidase subunit I [Myxococcota bacterium]|nr:cytochrome c oxidase subunit I [Myxococcota bacterium]
MATVDPTFAAAGSAAGRSSLPSRLHEWAVSVDHKRLGLMYIASGLLFFVVAGLEATAMRIQLAVPENDFVSPQTFNRLMTLHGTTMVFFVGMPIILGFANYLVPLMIGARDMAFPRLNAFSFWMSLFGGLLLYSSFLAAEGLFGGSAAPDVGWFAYAPLTERAFSPGNSTDYWNLAILVSGIGSIGTAINLIATTLCMRCRGMTLGKMPLLVWLNFVVAGLILIAIGPLTAAQIMLLLDRFLGAHFFDSQAGGSAVLWQHFFWIFGHPEVYILIMPGFAFASEIIPVFSRKVIFGYPIMVAASVAIGFISLSVWAHHMFAVGMTPAANTFFAVSTMLVAVPTGIKIFNWIATMWGGKIRFATPMLFCIAFLFQFLCAGLTGVMLACAPFDWQLTDSYFVVAHFHYVLIGGLLFTIFAAIYYWFPKATGRMLDETLGRWHFWLLVIGFNMTFLPQHFAGLAGMPRRIYTYEPGRGFEIWNQISSAGVIFQGAAIAFFLVNVVYSLARGAEAGDDPWDAWTLEWSTSSPPPAYNFEVLPEVRSRRPLWDLKHPDDPDWRYE